MAEARGLRAIFSMSEPFPDVPEEPFPLASDDDEPFSDDSLPEGAVSGDDEDVAHLEEDGDPRSLTGEEVSDDDIFGVGGEID